MNDATKKNKIASLLYRESLPKLAQKNTISIAESASLFLVAQSKRILAFLQSLINLIYPKLCASCQEKLLAAEVSICLSCESALPYTNFAIQPNNMLESLFWGKSPIELGSALFFYEDKGIVQNLLHELKYQENKRLGIRLGQMLGKQLTDSGRFDEITKLIPVPLHPKKKFQRGYNQASLIAQGISDVLQIPVDESILLRAKKTKTQTKMNRAERQENVSSAFRLNLETEFDENVHFLVVDDVITTGATLGECVNTLKSAGVKVSIAALACALKM